MDIKFMANDEYQQLTIINQSIKNKSSAKHKTPSRKLRNWMRAFNYREKLKEKTNKNTDLQSTKTSKWIKNIKKVFKKEPTKETKTPALDPQTSCQELITQIVDKNRDNELTGINQDPTKIYQKIEIDMRLSRLEDPSILITALRHITRKNHINGNKIAFPVPEAVDRVSLRCHSLPTAPEELRNLVENVFARRNEILDMEETYANFVLTHGRMAFDSSQKWPHCHIMVRHP